MLLKVCQTKYWMDLSKLGQMGQFERIRPNQVKIDVAIHLTKRGVWFYTPHIVIFPFYKVLPNSHHRHPFQKLDQFYELNHSSQRLNNHPVGINLNFHRCDVTGISVRLLIPLNTFGRRITQQVAQRDNGQSEKPLCFHPSINTEIPNWLFFPSYHAPAIYGKWTSFGGA